MSVPIPGVPSQNSTRSRRFPAPAMIAGMLALMAATGLSPARAQDYPHCARAEEFLAQQMAMETRVESDTLDDWRSGKRLSACRVTAAGTRRTSLGTAARTFYERVRSAGWTRTPNPADAPNEASLRFRMGNSDCLFNVYQGILLGTDAELAVTEAFAEQPTEQLYHVLVLCIPALEARVRGASPNS